MARWGGSLRALCRLPLPDRQCVAGSNADDQPRERFGACVALPAASQRLALYDCACDHGCDGGVRLRPSGCGERHWLSTMLRCFSSSHWSQQRTLKTCKWKTQRVHEPKEGVHIWHMPPLLRRASFHQIIHHTVGWPLMTLSVFLRATGAVVAFFLSEHPFSNISDSYTH